MHLLHVAVRAHDPLEQRPEALQQGHQVRPRLGTQHQHARPHYAHLRGGQQTVPPPVFLNKQLGDMITGRVFSSRELGFPLPWVL